MRGTYVKVFWGILLILGGAVFLAQNLGYIDVITDEIWIYTLGALSLASFLTYFLVGFDHWGWLFPAFILGGLAVTAWMVEQGVEGAALGTPVLAGVALPFLVVSALDFRKNWWGLIPGFIIGGVALITLVADQGAQNFIGSMVLYAMALPFVLVFLTDPRKRRWALIPGYIFLVLGSLPLVTDYVDGIWVPTMILSSIALPFLAVYLIDRTRKWGAIVAYILLAVSLLLPAVDLAAGSEAVASLILLAIAIPFWVTFIASANSGWAVIPAGILTSASVLVYLVSHWEFDDFGLAVLNGLFSLGIAGTFFLVWLRRATYPVDWAKYPAALFLVIGVFTLILGGNFTVYWPFFLIAGGILILIFSLRPRHAGP